MTPGRVHIKIESDVVRRSPLLLRLMLWRTCSQHTCRVGVDMVIIADDLEELRWHYWRGNMRRGCRKNREGRGRGDLYKKGRGLLYGDRDTLNRRWHLHWNDHGGSGESHRGRGRTHNRWPLKREHGHVAE